MPILSRRQFLLDLATTAAAFATGFPTKAAFGQEITSAESAPYGYDRMLGYNMVKTLEKFPELQNIGNAHSNMFRENLTNMLAIHNAITHRKGYQNFQENIRKYYKEKCAEHSELKDSVFLKATIVQAWVNHNYSYNNQDHYDQATEFGDGVHVTDKWDLPDTVLNKEKKPNCTEYAIAKYLGLLALNVPPENVRFVVGHSANSANAFQNLYVSSTDQGSHKTTLMNHAWVMLWDNDKGSWMSLSDMGSPKSALFYKQSGYGACLTKDGQELTDVEVPVMAIGGDQKGFCLFDSTERRADGTRLLKTIPKTKMDGIAIKAKAPNFYQIPSSPTKKSAPIAPKL